MKIMTMLFLSIIALLTLAVCSCSGKNVCSPNPCISEHQSQCRDSAGNATCCCDPGFINDDTGGCRPGQVVALTAGFHHTCALLDSGGVRCWGGNESGQLGNASKPDLRIPSDVVGLTTGVIGISAGRSHTCALLNDGTIKCWGDNYRGQLGNGIGGSGGSKDTPDDVVGLQGKAILVAAGDLNTCALLESGALMCWGDNRGGQLGNGTTNYDLGSSTPVMVNGLSGEIRSLAVGVQQTCALFTDDTVLCWGTGVDSLIPIKINGLEGGVRAMSSYAHTCFVLNGGNVKCFGNNESGELGNGTINETSTTELSDVIDLPNEVTNVTTGGSHTCALLQDGAMKCWGSNYDAELGNGSAGKPHPSPVDVRGLRKKAVAITAGFYYTCALLEDGGVQCWGDDDYDQLGDGEGGDYKVNPLNPCL